MASWQARRDRQKKLGRNGNGIGTPLTIAIALLPTPIADDTSPKPFLGGQRPSGTKRQIHLSDVVYHRLSRPAGCGQRLLPTPDTGMSPRGHGRRGGRAGNGRQSGSSLDAAARTVTPAAAGPVAWGEYEPAVRRWEQVLGRAAPAPAEPAPGRRPRLAAVFAEWMMGLPAGWVTAVPGLPRLAQLRVIGNGVVPQQAAAALRLLAETAAVPAPPGPAAPGSGGGP